MSFVDRLFYFGVSTIRDFTMYLYVCVCTKHILELYVFCAYTYVHAYYFVQGSHQKVYNERLTLCEFREVTKER